MLRVTSFGQNDLSPFTLQGTAELFKKIGIAQTAFSVSDESKKYCQQLRSGGRNSVSNTLELLTNWL